MKKTFQLLILLTALAVPLTFTGCGTPAAKTTQAAGSVAITVDAAMSAWGEWVRAGKATVPQRIKVRDAYAKYQGAMAVAETIAKTAIGAPQNEASYETALRAVSAASSDLVALVSTFTK